MQSSQIKQLRAKAHDLKPVVLLGAKGLTEAVIQEIDIALEAHELIKVKLAGSERDERQALSEAICEAVNATCVQNIGLMLVLYRKKM